MTAQRVQSPKAGDSGARAAVLDLAVIILTHNEEVHVARAIGSVSSLAREIVVVDSYSTDRTAEIARSLGATVLRNEFANYARQFQWALDHAPIAAQWIMRLDADEVVEADLLEEMKTKLPLLSDDIAGITLKRKHVFLGRWIRHGGRYPLMLLRIWRRGQGRIENRWMDEHIVVWGGRTVTFEGGFADHNLKDLTAFTEKHNKYATREAIDVLNRKYRLFPSDEVVTHESTSWQAATKRFLKENVYNPMPFQASALLYFLYRYFLQFGFLDGKEGLVYHVLQGFWYRFLVGAKVLELERAIAQLEEPAQIKAELARLTGLALD